MKRILAVDDSPSIRQMVNFTLTKGGFEVTEACDGKDGVEKSRGQKFDLVITDRAMPKMNGDQLATAIREIAPREPIILLTAFADSERHIRDIDLQLSKPASLRMIRQAIGKVMAAALASRLSAYSARAAASASGRRSRSART